MAISTVKMDKKGILDSGAPRRRIEGSLYAIREKDIRSATMERLKVTWEANAAVDGLPQQLQLGKGLHYILDHISVPVSPDDVILGRITEEIPDEEGEALLERTSREWRRGIPPWMQDGGHECFAWERLISFGLSGLEDFTRARLTFISSASIPP